MNFLVSLAQILEKSAPIFFVQKTKSGLVIPEKAQEKVNEATVVAVGSGARNKVCVLRVFGFGCYVSSASARMVGYCPCRLPLATGCWFPNMEGPNSLLTMR